MKKLLLAGLMAFAGVAGAHAAMPPDTYAGPLGARLGAQLHCTFTNFDLQHVVLPWRASPEALRPGDYVNPTTCQVVRAPAEGM